MSGNALPSSFANSGTATATPAPASTTNATNQSREVQGDISSDDVIRSGGSIASSLKAHEDNATVTTLAIIAALMGAGYVGLAVFFCLYRKRIAGIGEKRQHAEWVSSMTETAALNSTFDKYGGDE